MDYCKQKIKDSGEKWGITEIELFQYRYKWCIRNYSFCSKDIGEEIRSPTFSCADKSNVQWYLVLYPKGKNEECKDYLSLYLCLKCNEELKVEAEYALSIINNKNVETRITTAKNTFTHENCWAHRKFINRSFLVDKKKELLPNDTLTILCTIKAGIDCINLAGQKQSVGLKLSDCRLRIADDFEKLLEDGILSDVTLVCSGKVFKVHKNILAGRSPVFLAMFENNMKEKESNQVKIDDINPEVLKELLRFIYAAKIENLQELSRGLLAAADKYVINELKDICEDVICNDLVVENAVEILDFADLYRANKLKKQTTEFIIEHGKSIINKPEYNVIKKSKPHLLADIFQFMMVERTVKPHLINKQLKRKLDVPNTGNRLKLRR